MNKISIIVPVYNVEKFLPKCLDSLINQTYSDIEIICINDGSKDNSLEVLKEYSKKDNRIKVIDQENQGVAVARNIGIDKATGDYIMFVDSDDWLELNTCETLIKQLSQNDIDIIQFKFKKVFENKKTIPLQLSAHDTVQALNDMGIVLQENKTIFIWDKIYNLNFIRRNNVKFQKGLKAFEDYLFIAQLYEKNPKVKIIDDYFYNYYNNLNSVCNTDAYKRLKMHEEAFPYIEITLKQDEDLKNFSYSYYLQIMNYYWIELYFTEYKEDYFKELKKARSYISKEQITISTKLCDFNLMLAKWHLVWIYWKIIRPIGKYCIVLPYRKIISQLERIK